MATKGDPLKPGGKRGSVETAQSFTTELTGTTAVGPSQGRRHHQCRQHARQETATADLVRTVAASLIKTRGK